MRLLDLFCGAGGAAMGYYRAGFDEIVGIDFIKQKRFPFDFVLGNALNPPVDLNDFDLIHASPPCQRYSTITAAEYKNRHPDLIPATRKLLAKSNKFYVIENVSGARGKLINPVMLCGTMFGLPVWRHRFFETSPIYLFSPATCRHDEIPVLITGTTRRKGFPRVDPSAEIRRQALETPWMVITDMDQAIPPAYTEWIGRKIIENGAP